MREDTAHEDGQRAEVQEETDARVGDAHVRAELRERPRERLVTSEVLALDDDDGAADVDDEVEALFRYDLAAVGDGRGPLRSRVEAAGVKLHEESVLIGALDETDAERTLYVDGGTDDLAGLGRELVKGHVNSPPRRSREPSPD